MPISELLQRLERHQRRGSKPRCHLLTHGDRADVAVRLSSLIQPHGQVVSTDRWFPDGFADIGEAKLGETVGLLSDAHRKAVTNWWLEVPKGANTPNWDIAGTCTVLDKPGLFLVEAKAHLNELPSDGKKPRPTRNGKKNHEQTGRAITEANTALSRLCDDWGISRDSHYQLANRFAWSWKVASLGVPVILVYLGFLNADEMVDRGPLIVSEAEWMHTMHGYCQGIAPTTVWSQTLEVNGTPLVPLIRAMKLDLAVSSTTGASA
jgi:hypothetical protein